VRPEDQQVLEGRPLPRVPCSHSTQPEVSDPACAAQGGHRQRRQAWLAHVAYKLCLEGGGGGVSGVERTAVRGGLGKERRDKAGLDAPLKPDIAMGARQQLKTQPESPEKGSTGGALSAEA
jgi:hypothetical protein